MQKLEINILKFAVRVTFKKLIHFLGCFVDLVQILQVSKKHT